LNFISAKRYTLKAMKLPAHIDPSRGIGGIQRSEVSPLSSAEPLPAFKLIEGQLRKVKKLINEQLTTSTPAEPGVNLSMHKQGTDSVSRLLEYLNTHSGKMIRPGLVLLAGSAVGEITDEHIHVAAIIEMIHNATLLHDDVIDEGQKRRGQSTINSLWGNEFAVLLGDFLLSRVFKMCVKLQPQVAKEIAATAARVCEGELRQISEKQNWQLSEAQYIDIITEKSASLFSNCCRLGGLLAKGTEKQLQALARFGLNSGIAFQITDDLLDIIGDESRTGKTTGSDVDRNKPTLAVIHLLKVVDDPAPIRRGLSSIGMGLAEMLRSYGSLEYAQSRAREFVEKAIAELTALKNSDAKNALLETAKFVADRAV